MEKKISPTATIPMIEESVEADQAEAARTEVPVPTESTIEESSSKGSKDFSPEERATIIAMAKEVGFAKVALEFGIKARLISYWVQQEKKKASKSSKPTAAKGRSSSPTLGREKEAEHMEDTPTLAAEPAKAVETTRPAGRRSERTVSAEVQGSAEPRGSAEPAERSEGKQALTDRKTMTDEHVLIDRQSLIIENAILKERITLLNAEIEKLRAALTSLM